MESPGEHLKREREHRGVSLLKIFEATRVPMKYLEAIEADRVEGLPHPTFTKGYIRSYCKVLGLDENDAVLRFEVWLSEKAAEDQEAGKPRPIQELKRAKAAPTSKPRREIKIPANLGKAAIIAAGVIIVVLAYALSRRDLSVPEPQLVPPAPAIQATAEPSPSTEAVQAAEPAEPLSQAYSAGSTVKAEQPVPAALPAQPQPSAPAVAVPLPQPQTKPAQQAAPQIPAPAEPAKKEAPANGAVNELPKNHVLTANAKDMVWLKVGIDKAEPVEVLLRQGERATWTASDNISVIIGNAGGISLTYNGKSISGLGASGEVVGLRLPSGTSYKIKTPQSQNRPAETEPVAPDMAPAVNMPDVPAAQPQPVTGG